MLSEILLEALSFLDRSSLEACQLVDKSFLRTITKSNAVLALRPMHILIMVRLTKSFMFPSVYLGNFYISDRFSKSSYCSVLYEKSNDIHQGKLL